MFTCIECEFPFDISNGDTDERMCHQCMDDDSDEIDTTSRTWYEVAVTWDDDNGTETIASFDRLEQAKKFMNGKSLTTADIFQHIENVFIDKWIRDGGHGRTDDKFIPIIRTVGKKED